MICRFTTIFLIWSLIIFYTLSLCGCVTRYEARAEARAAYAAGQKDAYAALAASQRTNIVVHGPVQNSIVPWVESMTLAQAIATANYISPDHPNEIILLRRGESATINPNDLLNGHDVPLEPGDSITLH